jgi:YVTN family beta-propeller protein
LAACAAPAIFAGCGSVFGIDDVTPWDGGSDDGTMQQEGQSQADSPTTTDVTMEATQEAAPDSPSGRDAGMDSTTGGDARPDVVPDQHADVIDAACDAAGQVCNPGGNTCQQGITDCTGACTNVTNVTDLTACGTAGVCCGGTCASCTAPTHGAVACNGTGCSFTCDANHTACGQACVDTQTDPSNCGGCGNGCDGGFCSGGMCGVHEVYVPNGGAADAGSTVTVFAYPSNNVVTTIPIGISTAATELNWNRVAISQSSPRNAYVTNYGAGTVVAIDTSTHAIAQTVTLGTSAKPWSIAVSPDGKNVAVAERGGNQVVYIDTTSWQATPIAMTTFVQYPSTVQYKPDGTELWVGCGGGTGTPCASGGDGVRRFTYPGYSWIGDINIATVAAGNSYMTFLPDSSAAFVSGQCGCCGNVQEISTSSLTSLWNQSNQNSGAVALSPDAKSVFMSNEGPSCGADNFVKYDVATHMQVVSVTAPTNTCTYGLAASPDGNYVYAADVCGGNVLMLDATSLSVAHTITGQISPTDVAFR